jgi:Zn-finger nucleic acid-binding protein
VGDDPYRRPGERSPDEPEPDPRGPWVLQTWTSTLLCPDCAVSLFAARKEGFRIDACGSCGGAWLDHATAKRAIAERSLVPAHLSEAASARASWPRASGRERSCPVCSARLEATVVPDARVILDVCYEHGAWFDPHEMRPVIEAMVRREPPRIDPEVDRIIERTEEIGRLRPMERPAPTAHDWVEAITQIVEEARRVTRKP